MLPCYQATSSSNAYHHVIFEVGKAGNSECWKWVEQSYFFIMGMNLGLSLGPRRSIPNPDQKGPFLLDMCH